MTRLKLDDDATEATFREALTLKGLEKYGKVIGQYRNQIQILKHTQFALWD